MYAVLQQQVVKKQMSGIFRKLNNCSLSIDRTLPFKDPIITKCIYATHVQNVLITGSNNCFSTRVALAQLIQQ